MAKVGRNEQCPCGSGKKYKRCHGSVNHTNAPIPDIGNIRARTDAARVQRERQQGLGKPIISADFNGRRLVAVKNRLLHSTGWLTFQDFLCSYIKSAIGAEWGTAEIAKPIEQRHPILVWYDKLCAYQQTFLKVRGKVHATGMTGAVAAYMHLAYDLYTLDHNAELQGKLLDRLRNHDQFAGARYEVYVAALFVRAGFDIEFENERDGTTTHCEFTATYRGTGKHFSVEAKRREGTRFNVGGLLNAALSKHANHERVVFIDVNMPDEARDQTQPRFLQRALERLRLFFDGKPLNGQLRPPAYVFLTNTPWAHHLDAPEPRITVLVEGFQIPDFKGGITAPSLRHAIEARKLHVEMHALKQSIKDHSGIPSTFDGEIPEYAFHTKVPQIVIGQSYMVKDHDGVERSAELTTATVAEQERVAYCGMKFEDGRSVNCTIPLSTEELSAWKQHPDTFFGIVGQRHTRADSPLEMYDFCLESFKQISRERLLEVMANSPDIEDLAKLDQPQLASIHAERMTNAALGMATGTLETPTTTKLREIKSY